MCRAVTGWTKMNLKKHLKLLFRRKSKAKRDVGNGFNTESKTEYVQAEHPFILAEKVRNGSISA